jgi:hypothetical protein
VAAARGIISRALRAVLADWRVTRPQSELHLYEAPEGFFRATFEEQPQQPAEDEAEPEDDEQADDGQGDEDEFQV